MMRHFSEETDRAIDNANKEAVGDLRRMRDCRVALCSTGTRVTLADA